MHKTKQRDTPRTITDTTLATDIVTSTTALEEHIIPAAQGNNLESGPTQQTDTAPTEDWNLETDIAPPTQKGKTSTGMTVE